jgi:hypothetical protein
VIRLLILLTALLPLTACSVRAPELDAAISVQIRNADWPELVPLGPLLADTEDLSPDRDGSIGRDLQARAADLRRRAAILRALRLT